MFFEDDEYFVPDYWFCSQYDTPAEVRKKLNIGDIYWNAAICNLCGDFIRSKNMHDFRQCSCGAIAVDGGSWYIKRHGKNEDRTSVILLYKDLHNEDY